MAPSLVWIWTIIVLLLVAAVAVGLWGKMVLQPQNPAGPPRRYAFTPRYRVYSSPRCCAHGGWAGTLPFCSLIGTCSHELASLVFSTSVGALFALGVCASVHMICHFACL